MNYLKKTIFFLMIFTAEQSIAQSNYFKMGMQAWMKGDYKNAVAQLEKAASKDPNNANTLKMLGYSYYQSGDFENSISTYSRLIDLKSNDVSAFYYRGKARQNIANDPKESLNQMRESFYLSSIKDFTKAIELSGEEDIKLFQNRGLVYKDYAIFKSYKIQKKAEKAACVAIFKNAIADFEKVLLNQPQRKDIVAQIDYVKAQITSLK
ncbi:tetratricopeptide repeat protein [Pedobacter sp. SYP-B3415]|uniref:tetratricopeptide repeat protein n=1 Tax=Pedobacter sp. SYP-B3415 TaxID=2496641 RepID=UPI00101DE0C9|nr:tetratricopeptide repeat protein [Pedobacter sp. SYP-B3415]